MLQIVNKWNNKYERIIFKNLQKWTERAKFWMCLFESNLYKTKRYYLLKSITVFSKKNHNQWKPFINFELTFKFSSLPLNSCCLFFSSFIVNYRVSYKYTNCSRFIVLHLTFDCDAHNHELTQSLINCPGILSVCCLKMWTIHK